MLVATSTGCTLMVRRCLLQLVTNLMLLLEVQFHVGFSISIFGSSSHCCFAGIASSTRTGSECGD